MSWKEWPSWLKGGIIGLIIFVSINIIAFLLSLLATDVGGGIIFIFTSYFPAGYIFSFLATSLSGFINILVINALIYFIVGALIGKIKS